MGLGCGVRRQTAGAGGRKDGSSPAKMKNVKWEMTNDKSILRYLVFTIQRRGYIAGDMIFHWSFAIFQLSFRRLIRVTPDFDRC